MQMNTKEGYCFFIRHEFVVYDTIRSLIRRNTANPQKLFNKPLIQEGWVLKMLQIGLRLFAS